MDEKKLWTDFWSTRGSDEKNRLALCYLPLVRKIAGKIQSRLPRDVEFHDLMQEGVLGLLSAIDNYNEGVGASFKSFSSYRISGAIRDYLRRIDPLRRDARASVNLMRDVSLELSRDDGIPPSLDDLSSACGISVREILRLEGLTQPAKSFRSHELPSKGPNPSEGVAKKDFIKFLSRGLNRQERLVIVLYYYEEMTLLEIAAVLDVTESGVSQIKKRALAHMRKYLREKGVSEEMLRCQSL